MSVTNRIYMIFDEKAGSCVGTFMSLSDAQARRSFEDLIFNWQPSVYNEHPEDFSLFKLLEFECGDTPDGPVWIDDTVDPHCILRGSEYSRAFIDNERIKRRIRFFSVVGKEDVSRETE